jgi:type IV secretion system protein TrbL
VVLLAFFVLAVQLFITLIEFKLATLCGFVLIPFGLFGKTAFMAERVLGNVISSGVKVLVLAVILGIGSTLFSQFTTGFGDEQPSIEDAMAIVLAALSLLGLGIFGPGIANGIVSGGPQLGAGAAAGTALAAGGMLAGGAAAARLAGGAAVGAVAGATRGAAFASGAASNAYSLGSAGKSGAASVAGGLGGVGKAALGAAMSPLRKAAEAMKQSHQAGGAAPGAPQSAASSEASGPPAWAAAMKRRQTMAHAATIGAHTLRSGDSSGAGASVDVSQKD